MPLQIKRYVNGEAVSPAAFFGAKYKNERASSLLGRVMGRAKAPGAQEKGPGNAPPQAAAGKDRGLSL